MGPSFIPSSVAINIPVLLCRQTGQAEEDAVKRISVKTHSWSKSSKKSHSEEAKPRKLTKIKHFCLFFRTPRALKKESKWELKWSLRASKSSKIPKREHSKKTIKKEIAKSLKIEAFGGGVGEFTFFKEIWQWLQKSSKWAPGLENECPGLEKHQKIDLQTSEMSKTKDHSAYKKQDFWTQDSKQIEAARWRVMRAAHWMTLGTPGSRGSSEQAEGESTVDRAKRNPKA